MTRRSRSGPRLTTTSPSSAPTPRPIRTSSRADAKAETDKNRAEAQEQAERMLSAAQEQADSTLASAKEEAENARKSAAAEAQQVVADASRQAETAVATAKSQAKQQLDEATARATAIHDGAERRLNLLMSRHTEAVRRLTEIRDVVTTLVAGEVDRGSLEDEVARIVAGANGSNGEAQPVHGRPVPAGRALRAGTPAHPASRALNGAASWRSRKRRSPKRRSADRGRSGGAARAGRPSASRMAGVSLPVQPQRRRRATGGTRTAGRRHRTRLVPRAMTPPTGSRSSEINGAEERGGRSARRATALLAATQAEGRAAAG